MSVKDYPLSQPGRIPSNDWNARLVEIIRQHAAQISSMQGQISRLQMTGNNGVLTPVSCKITSVIGKGRYKADAYLPPYKLATTGDLAATELGSPLRSCWLINLSELNGGSALVKDNWVLAASGGPLLDGVPVMIVGGGGGSGFHGEVVSLSNATGGGGTNAVSAPTWNYNVSSADGGTLYGTGIGLIAAHDNRKLKVHRASGTMGLALINSNNTVNTLLDVFDESPDEQVCG